MDHTVTNILTRVVVLTLAMVLTGIIRGWLRRRR
jgi:hypothetical protein